MIECFEEEVKTLIVYRSARKRAILNHQKQIEDTKLGILNTSLNEIQKKSLIDRHEVRAQHDQLKIDEINEEIKKYKDLIRELNQIVNPSEGEKSSVSQGSGAKNQRSLSWSAHTSSLEEKSSEVPLDLHKSKAKRGAKGKFGNNPPSEYTSSSNPSSGNQLGGNPPAIKSPDTPESVDDQDFSSQSPSYREGEQRSSDASHENAKREEEKEEVEKEEEEKHRKGPYQGDRRSDYEDPDPGTCL